MLVSWTHQNCTNVTGFHLKLFNVLFGNSVKSRYRGKRVFRLLCWGQRTAKMHSPSLQIISAWKIREKNRGPTGTRTPDIRIMSQCNWELSEPVSCRILRISPLAVYRSRPKPNLFRTRLGWDGRPSRVSGRYSNRFSDRTPNCCRDRIFRLRFGGGGWGTEKLVSDISGNLSVFSAAYLCVLGKGSGDMAVGNSGFSRF